MTPAEQEALQYRFSGYQLQLIQFDETGPAYVVIQEPHPYYRNQPTYWQKPAYRGSALGTTEIIGGNIQIDQSGNVHPNTGSGLINLMDF